MFTSLFFDPCCSITTHKLLSNSSLLSTALGNHQKSTVVSIIPLVSCMLKKGARGKLNNDKSHRKPYNTAPSDKWKPLSLVCSAFVQSGFVHVIHKDSNLPLPARIYSPPRPVFTEPQSGKGPRGEYKLSWMYNRVEIQGTKERFWIQIL